MSRKYSLGRLGCNRIGWDCTLPIPLAQINKSYLENNQLIFSPIKQVTNQQSSIDFACSSPLIIVFLYNSSLLLQFSAI